MKVALVILHADPARGGAERYTHDLAEALARSHDVSLLASTFAAAPTSGVRQISLSADGLTRTRRYQHFLQSLDNHLNDERYDVVHAMLPVRRCDLYHPHAGLAARSVETATGLKRLNNAVNPRRAAFAEMERSLLAGERPPMLLCLSQAMRQNVIADGVCSADRATVLFNAVDLKRFDPIAFPHQPSGRLTALIVAQDFERKGLGPAIEAIAQATAWHLLVVGKDAPAKYQRLAATLKCADRVTWTGPLADVRPMYQQADVFLLPTSHDPCSLVVLEALAMGVPVISTIANGACEIMTNGVHGFILDNPVHPASIAHALESLADPRPRAAMRAACLTLRPGLSFNSHVRRLNDIFEPLTSKPRNIL